MRLATLCLCFVIAGCAKVSISPAPSMPPETLYRPCIRSAADIPQTNPCADVGKTACAKRLALVRRVYASTVSVLVKRFTVIEGVSDRYGTGVVVTNDGLVLTAYHVVEHARYISATIRRLDENLSEVEVREIPMTVEAVSKEKDVALLRPEPDERMPAPLPIKKDAVNVNDRVWHFGNISHWTSGPVVQTKYPLTERDEPTVSVKNAIVDNAMTHFGDSGGPAVTPDGELVGILLATQEDADPPLSYFIPIATALAAVGVR